MNKQELETVMASGKMINGRPAEEAIRTMLGIPALLLLERELVKMLQQSETLSPAQYKLLQFMIEKSWGTATKQVEVTSAPKTTIVAKKLEHLDETALRAIANLNGPKDERHEDY